MSRLSFEGKRKQSLACSLGVLHRSPQIGAENEKDKKLNTDNISRLWLYIWPLPTLKDLGASRVYSCFFFKNLLLY